MVADKEMDARSTRTSASGGRDLQNRDDLVPMESEYPPASFAELFR
jgi:hypothetical protein